MLPDLLPKKLDAVILESNCRKCLKKGKKDDDDKEKELQLVDGKPESSDKSKSGKRNKEKGKSQTAESKAPTEITYKTASRKSSKSEKIGQMSNSILNQVT